MEIDIPQRKSTVESTTRRIHYEDGAIYELPMRSTPVRGLLFIAHACTHMAEDFWVSSKACPGCIGLAEESLIVLNAINVGFIAVAMNSSDRSSGCWGPADRRRVSSRLHQIRHSLNATRYPVFALGASSGGSFVWGMAARGEFDGAIVQVMGIDTSVPIKIAFPIILNAMRRDKHIFERMEENFVKLQQRFNKSIVQFQECFPLPVTADYILSRMPELGLSRTSAIIDALESSGNIDKVSKFLTRDPTAINNPWRDELLRRIPESHMHGIILTRGRSRLAKVLHRAWAFHEYCADGVAGNLLWMERTWLENSRQLYKYSE